MIQAAVAFVLVTLGLAVLYAIHRRQRQLEEWGFVEPTKKAGGAPFVVLQEFIQPSVAHVLHVQEERQHRAERDVPGEGGS